MGLSNITLFYLEDLKTKFDKINPNEYYLSYSGGKDSHLLYWFIKEYAKIEGIEVVSMNTYMEHPQILKRIIKNSDRILVPDMKPFEIKEKYGIPCFSKSQDKKIHMWQRGLRTDALIKQIHTKGSRFSLNNKARTMLLDGSLHKVSGECCTHLKKNPAKKYEKESGKKPIIGVRGSESTMRKSRYTSCFTKTGSFVPLWDLSDEWMDLIYKECNIEIPEVYNHIGRTGCMGCPYGSFKKQTRKELMLIPEFRRDFVVEYFKESYEVLGIDLDFSKTDEDILIEKRELAKRKAKEKRELKKLINE